MEPLQALQCYLIRNVRGLFFHILE